MSADHCNCGQCSETRGGYRYLSPTNITLEHPNATDSRRFYPFHSHSIVLHRPITLIFKIQIEVITPRPPTARPSQPVPYESTAKFLRLRKRSISASIDLNCVLQLNTFRVRLPSRPMFNTGYDLMNQKPFNPKFVASDIILELTHVSFTGKILRGRVAR
jgi:hypothetical protein